MTMTLLFGQLVTPVAGQAEWLPGLLSHGDSYD